MISVKNSDFVSGCNYNVKKIKGLNLHRLKTLI